MSAAFRTDRPVNDRPPASYGELMGCVTHPAFRLGFIDAQSGRPPDHDRIGDRIQVETPKGALQRLGYTGDLFGHEVALAQYRYEEGRLLHLQFGLSCKAWGHPDYPPAAVQRYVEQRAALAAARAGDQRKNGGGRDG